MALLDAFSGLPLVGSATELDNSDVFLNLQAVGQQHIGGAVSVSDAGQPATPTLPTVWTNKSVELDLKDVPAGTAGSPLFPTAGFRCR